MKKQSLLLAFFVFGFLAPALILAANAPVRPYKFKGEFRVIGVQWANPQGGPAPGVVSTFDGRCSVPSDYLITFGLVGEATHLGRTTGTAQHCSQLIWTTEGPAGATYSDGRFSATAADGDIVKGTYTNGTSGAYENGLLWFHDFYTITGGTGRFLEATGGGEEGGTFSDFFALLSGAPVAMWMEGTIAYEASDRR